MCRHQRKNLDCGLRRDNTIYLFDIQAGKLKQDFVSDACTPRSVLVADSSRVLFVESDGSVREWSLSKGGLSKRITTPVDGIDTQIPATVSRDGGRIAYCKGTSIQICSVNPHRPIRRIEMDPPSTFACGLNLSPDGRYLAVFIHEALDYFVYIYNVENGSIAARLPQDDHGVTSMCWSPDARSLAVASPNHVALVERVIGGERARWPVRGVSTIAFSKDGQRIAFGTVLGTVQMIGLGRRTPAAEFIAGEKTVTALTISPNGSRIAAAAWDTIRVWEPNGKLVRSFIGHGGRVSGLAFTPNGGRLISTSDDGTSLVWALSEATDPLSKESTATKLEQNWLDLGSRDAAKAFAAMQELRLKPEDAITLIQDRLKPTKALPRSEVLQLIQDLGDSKFVVREHALKNLQSFDLAVENELRAALRTETGSEVRSRIQGLLKESESAPTRPDLLRGIRAVELLESLRSPKAIAAIKLLAGGADSRTTREAKAAFVRAAKEK